MKTLLHVGCGPANMANLPSFFHDGQWEELRYDIDESVSPDIVGTLQDMSLIDDGSVDAIFSSHNIEHVWAFEVNGVLSEFLRVLKPEGFAIVLCPDIMSVAQAVTQGALTNPLYHSPAGPISAIDIIYGHQKAIEHGNHFMAHKTAFTAETLAEALLTVGFSGASITRDKIFGLHSIASKEKWDTATFTSMAKQLKPIAEHSLENIDFGCYANAMV